MHLQHHDRKTGETSFPMKTAVLSELFHHIGGLPALRSLSTAFRTERTLSRRFLLTHLAPVNVEWVKKIAPRAWCAGLTAKPSGGEPFARSRCQPLYRTAASLLCGYLGMVV
jgi:hypothetical protein